MSEPLTPERRAALRRLWLKPPGEYSVCIPARELTALLDAADERDQLLTVVHEADQLHVAALAAEGELLGDSPEMPRWERLLLNGLTLPELAKNVADERDQMAAAVERVRALHERDGEGFCVVCDYMTPHPCPTLRALGDRDE